MKKFLLLYHTPEQAVAQMANMPPEQRAEKMKSWIDWKEEVGDDIAETGSPMIGRYRLNSGGYQSTLKSDLNGYSFIQAKDVEEAVSILKSHPQLKWADETALELFECYEISC